MVWGFWRKYLWATLNHCKWSPWKPKCVMSLRFGQAFIKTKQQGVTRGTWFSKGGTRCPCTLKLKKSLPWIGLRGQLLNILASRALGLQIFLLLVLISHNYWFLIGFELLWHHGKNLLFTFFSTFRYREKRWKHFLLNSLVCVESYL